NVMSSDSQAVSVPGTNTPFIVASAPMAALIEAADRAALSDGKVLITGESGVGKDVIARRIHSRSRRTNHPFVPVNCAGLTESLLESELFGHVKGSFTGAYRDKLGKLQTAHRGTIFLDEVGEMSLRMQAILLRFLENGEIQAVGSDLRQATVDVRVIAATNRNLPELIAAGQFREDFFYRLRVIHLEVPPLRLRRDEIPILVNHFIARTHRRASFTAEAMEALCRYRWPGNVRELQNVVEQAMWLSRGDLVDLASLPEVIKVPAQPIRPTRERRVQIADELYAALVSGGYSFWDHIYPLFLSRDITRHDMRELVRKGLSTTRGNYRQLLKLFGMANQDYKRFLNFLAAHDCGADFRAFRHGTAEAQRPPRLILPPLPAKATLSTESKPFASAG
ncbi:MAG TPA: sigma-54 dependent transcriptional regulator, partial [Gemmatimonadaceae bacterium]|nr:sigma-54 dependent transcriptional regulator [Gemmatimonadaceae bacterium]